MIKKDPKTSIEKYTNAKIFPRRLRFIAYQSLQIISYQILFKHLL